MSSRGGGHTKAKKGLNRKLKNGKDDGGVEDEDETTRIGHGRHLRKILHRIFNKICNCPSSRICSSSFSFLRARDQFDVFALHLKSTSNYYYNAPLILGYLSSRVDDENEDDDDEDAVCRDKVV